jgi:L-methionine (R)-S-oxide reductase
MYQASIPQQEWLETFVAERDGKAGTVHVRRGVDLYLTAAHNIPPQVIARVAHVPQGKGMAGAAQTAKAPVQTCNLQTDRTGSIEGGARAVDAQAAIALPVFDDDGSVRAVVGIAWDWEGEVVPSDEQSMMRAASTLPRVT